MWVVWVFFSYITYQNTFPFKFRYSLVGFDKETFWLLRDQFSLVAPQIWVTMQLRLFPASVMLPPSAAHFWISEKIMDLPELFKYLGNVARLEEYSNSAGAASREVLVPRFIFYNI